MLLRIFATVAVAAMWGSVYTILFVASPGRLAELLLNCGISQPSIATIVALILIWVPYIEARLLPQSDNEVPPK